MYEGVILSIKAPMSFWVFIRCILRFLWEYSLQFSKGYSSHSNDAFSIFFFSIIQETIMFLVTGRKKLLLLIWNFIIWNIQEEIEI